MSMAPTMAECNTDCVSVHVLPDGMTVEFLGILEVGPSGQQVSREALRPTIGHGLEIPIPLGIRSLQDISVGVLPGCRYGWIDRGLEVGLRPGARLRARAGAFGTIEFFLLSVVQERAFGVYDVHRLHGED